MNKISKDIIGLKSPDILVLLIIVYKKDNRHSTPPSPFSSEFGEFIYKK